MIRLYLLLNCLVRVVGGEEVRDGLVLRIYLRRKRGGDGFRVVRIFGSFVCFFFFGYSRFILRYVE